MTRTRILNNKKGETRIMEVIVVLNALIIIIINIIVLPLMLMREVIAVVKVVGNTTVSTCPNMGALDMDHKGMILPIIQTSNYLLGFGFPMSA